MVRDNLERLGLNLPLPPTTAVGSFPKPPSLMRVVTQATKEFRNELGKNPQLI